MTHKVYAVICKCWNAIYCTCKNVMNFKFPESQDSVEHWKRIEHVDQYTKKRY